MNDIININLYSDTQTRPSAGMLRAMGEAEVGDEQHRQDPSVIISVVKLQICWKRKPRSSCLPERCAIK